MTPNPFSGLLHSRKFWIAMLDAIIALATLWIGQLFSPETQKMILQTLAILQPVFLTVIASIAHEDAAQIKADGQVQAAQAAGEAQAVRD